MSIIDRAEDLASRKGTIPIVRCHAGEIVMLSSSVINGERSIEPLARPNLLIILQNRTHDGFMVILQGVDIVIS
jgi:hypothetical protein